MSNYAKYECLKVEVSEKVATVTLNRPEARNAINQKLIRELRTIWDDLADDHAVNAVVLTGAGDFFSVGGDVKAMSERPGGDVLEEGEVPHGVEQVGGPVRCEQLRPHRKGELHGARRQRPDQQRRHHE